MIKIDGSFGEGGGQILRVALALSAITGKPIKVFNIRAKRENPGLRPQHLLAVKALAEICNAKVEGAKIGSKELLFEPSSLKGGDYNFDVGTAGSVTLVLQALLPALCFAENPSRITIRGGTSVPKSPTVDYIKEVLLEHLKKLGFKASIELKKHGFYPKGGGIVEAEVFPSKLNNIILDNFGELLNIKIRSYSEGLPCHIVEREVNEALKIIGLKDDRIEFSKECNDPRSQNIGNYFFIKAKSRISIIGYDSVGAKGVPAERVAEIPTKNLIEAIRLNSATDYFAGDQLLIWLALSKGESLITTHKFTLHAFTTLHLLKEILEIDFSVEGNLEEFAKIRIFGKGF